MTRSAEEDAAKRDAAVPVRTLATEDWITAGLGLLLLLALLAWGNHDLRVTLASPNPTAESWQHPLAKWVGSLDKWDTNPLEAFSHDGQSLVGKILGSALLLAGIGSLGMWSLGRSITQFVVGFVGMFLLATAANLLAGQKVILYYNLEYALWALLLGLLISNTIGTPAWLWPAVRGEFFIKLGLVLLGAEVLFSKLLALGLPGVCVAWIVTPIVLISTYIFGQRVLRIPSRSLNMVISADMSVCGVSAAIATSAACRAKKEELSLAVGMSLVFTVIMMVLMPPLIHVMGLSPQVGGAWLGGTIDSTGAVAAAGSALGEEGEKVAVTVKMIQNILIGVVAVVVAAYWTKYVDVDSQERVSVSWMEVWRRFPKFILGFLASSILVSVLFSHYDNGVALVTGTTGSVGKALRGWLFALAFVSIGLETNFRQLLPYLRSGKPVLLYVCGQSLNLVLTLAMAYLCFGKLFQ